MTADPTRPPREVTPEERALIEVAVTEELKDPTSPLFARSMQIFGSMLGEGTAIETWLVCGRVNAKNSYGGYTGQQSFLASLAAERGRFDARLIDIASTDINRQLIGRICSEAGVKL